MINYAMLEGVKCYRKKTDSKQRGERIYKMLMSADLIEKLTF